MQSAAASIRVPSSESSVLCFVFSPFSSKTARRRLEYQQRGSWSFEVKSRASFVPHPERIAAVSERKPRRTSFSTRDFCAVRKPAFYAGKGARASSVAHGFAINKACGRAPHCHGRQMGGREHGLCGERGVCADTGGGRCFCENFLRPYVAPKTRRPCVSSNALGGKGRKDTLARSYCRSSQLRCSLRRRKGLWRRTLREAGRRRR